MSTWKGTYEGRTAVVEVEDQPDGPDRSSYVAWVRLMSKLDVPAEHRSPEFVQLTRLRRRR